MKATTKQAYFRSTGRLLLPLLSLLLLLSSPGGAQSVVGQAVLNDLTFILGPDEPRGSRREVYDEMYAFATRHQLVVSLTTLAEGDLYAFAVRQQENSLLQQSTPVLAITTWYEIEPKVLQRIQVQVNPALTKRLPQATAEQIITEWLTYYEERSPIAEDALRQGMLLALERLDAYLNALPPDGKVLPVTFANPAAVDNNPPTGLDELRYPTLQGNYEQLEISEAPYPVAWKALPSGKTTPVLAQVADSLSFPPGLVFVQNGNRVATQPASQTHRQQLTLTGQAHQQEGSVEVYASDEEDAPLVGKLNTISYDVLPKTLVLIDLDYTISEYGAEVQQTGRDVQAIFAQAGVALEVRFEHFRTSWGDRDVPLEDNTAGLLSNYPRGLKRVIKDYRKARDEPAEAETAYIFLAGSGTSGRKGYMPKKRAYGFVFVHQHTARESLARTIAHELGHGWFRLQHSWQHYPALTQGSSDNLMDYGTGSRLHKDQWDLIHYPVSMMGWFQNEDDVSDFTNRTDVEWIVEFYSRYHFNEFKKAYDLPPSAQRTAALVAAINTARKGRFKQKDFDGLLDEETKKAMRTHGDDPLATALLKHYPSAKKKEMYVYYTDWRGAVVAPVAEPLELKGELPIDPAWKSTVTPDTPPSAALVKEEIASASTEIQYDFVWETMTDNESLVDRGMNFAYELVEHREVDRNDTQTQTVLAAIKAASPDEIQSQTTDRRTIYTYDYVIGEIHFPIAIHKVAQQPIFKRKELAQVTLSPNKPYTLLAFGPSSNLDDIQLMLQVANEHADVIKEYFSQDDEVAQKKKPAVGGKVAPKKMLADAATATEVARKYTSTTACNICVRAALYLMKDDPALFPTSKSGYHNPTNKYVREEIEGYITPEGRAIRIKEDFDNLAGKPKLNERFVQIRRGADEGWQAYFKRLQDEADLGQIIIGVMLNADGDEGHIVMITPGGLIEIDEKTTELFPLSFITRGIEKVLRVLECGGTLRETEGSLYLRVDGKGATERMKWFKYLK